MPENSHQHDEYGSAGDEYVGNIEHGEVGHADEVDDMAAQWPRGSKNPIGQVAADPGNEHATSNKRPALASARHPPYTYGNEHSDRKETCLLYTSPSPRDVEESRMPSSA